MSAEGERNWCGLRLLGGSTRGDDPVGYVMGIVVYRVYISGCCVDYRSDINSLCIGGCSCGYDRLGSW